jgi:hypothetical protein
VNKTPKEAWLGLVATVAEQYYDEANNQDFVEEELEADESGDVADGLLIDFGVWLKEQGWRQ